jgi:serine/threonine protein kinase
MPLSAGSQLGPYEIREVIGSGGMGEVYRAIDTRLRREVAVKISAERFSDRFEREARAVASLNHPNICTLHDVGANYLVMELVDGETLAERIQRGPLPLLREQNGRSRPTEEGVHVGAATAKSFSTFLWIRS